MIGRTLAHYAITASLGKGGMGEVFQARDTKLERDVAIKVLPESFTADVGRVARFEQEAKTLAALNHTNIAQVYGFEKVDGTTAIVMELVEGPTLADRIAGGPIPADEAMGIALQIADALEAAHELNIVHRDLKPANVKLKADGTVKVLDFGIAKAVAPELAGTASPIMTTPVTQVGVILGTAAYMSPEQARGKRVDKRTDIWAFGCVLYEMLTGQLAFGGEDVAVILARVIANDTDLKSLPAAISPAVQRTIALCLQKDIKKRLRDIGDVKLALAGAFETEGARGEAGAAREPVFRRALVPAGMLVAGALLAAGAAWTLRPPPEPRPVNRFAYSIPADQPLRALAVGAFALAPDGRRFLYNTVRGIFVRELGELEPRLVPGTESGGAQPLFSPDGQSIAYASPDQWNRIAVTGGASVPIGARAGTPFGASWDPNGTIYFAQPSGIFRVPATGGTPELLIAPESGEQLYGPSLLPDGDSLLFSISGGNAAERIVAQSLATGERKELLTGGADARYVPTGHIVYAFDDDLFGAAFDLETLTVSGGQVPLVQGVMRASLAAGASFGIANDGTLAYVGGTTGGNSTLVWVDREGREEAVAIEPSSYIYPRISPDGRRVALDDRNSDNDDWIWDFATETRTRLTVGGIGGVYPAWTADGSRLAHTDTGAAIVVVAANDTGVALTLVAAGALAGGSPSPYFFTPDDRMLVFRDQDNPDSGDDILMVAIDGASIPVTLLAAPYHERNAELSPDGRFMAYQSDESGRFEIYVRPFPNVDADRVQISNTGGAYPLWSRDGRELFYLEGNTPQDRRLMAVAVEPTDGRFAFRERRGVLEWPYVQAEGRGYDVALDGQRFLAIKEGTGDAANPIEIVIVQNWTEELQRLVPTN